MIAALCERMKGLKSFQRGVHPPHRKKYTENTADRAFRAD